jgi:hypothetical protein
VGARHALFPVSHPLGALAKWRAGCSPTLLTAAGDAFGLIAGPSRPFQTGIYRVRSLRPVRCPSADESPPDGVLARLQESIRTGTLTTGTAAACGCALAPCDGSDLLSLRLHSTCSWVTSFDDAAPSLESWREVANPAPFHPAHAAYAPRWLPSRAFGWENPTRTCAAYWSCSSSRNPLGNCISARPETGLGPDSARTRFLTSRLTAQFLTSQNWIGCDTVQRNW